MAADTCGGGLGQPATNGFAVTPHDTNELSSTVRALYVGGSGNITLRLKSGDIILLVGLVAGSIVGVRADKVYSTGTSATSIVGLL